MRSTIDRSMGIQEEIIEIFLSELSSNEEIPTSLATKLGKIIKSKTLDEASFLKILEESIPDD